MSPPSHCDVCRRRLSAFELVPVLSYLRLRGRCRSCDTRIPLRVLWVELGTGLFFVLAFWHYGPGLRFALIAFYFCLFLVLALIDLDHQLILNSIVYPAAIIPLVFAFILPEPGILYVIMGGAIGFVLLLIPAVISRGGMGWGDVKMAALIGLVTGFPQVIVALLMGIILGGVVAAILLAFKLKKRKEGIPFGPFLSIATMITLIWGNAILHWYLGLAMF